MSVFQRLISKHLPSNVKRLVLLTTLGMKLKGECSSEERRNFIRRLNIELDLAKEEGALNFAIAFSDFIWKQLTDKTPADMKKLLEFILSKIPKYLQYNSDKIIKDDIRRVIVISCY